MHDPNQKIGVVFRFSLLEIVLYQVDCCIYEYSRAVVFRFLAFLNLFR
jgi:hypothetical protein